MDAQCNPLADSYGVQHTLFDADPSETGLQRGRAYGNVRGGACAWAPIIKVVCSSSCVNRTMAGTAWPCSAQTEVRTVHAGHCAELCVAESGCDYFAYDTTLRECWLLRAVACTPGFGVNPDWISGAKGVLLPVETTTPKPDAVTIPVTTPVNVTYRPVPGELSGEDPMKAAAPTASNEERLRELEQRLQKVEDEKRPDAGSWTPDRLPGPILNLAGGRAAGGIRAAANASEANASATSTQLATALAKHLGFASDGSNSTLLSQLARKIKEMIGLEAAKAARAPAPAPGPALVVGPGGIGQGAGSSVAANNQFLINVSVPITMVVPAPAKRPGGRGSAGRGPASAGGPGGPGAQDSPECVKVEGQRYCTVGRTVASTKAHVAPSPTTSTMMVPVSIPISAADIAKFSPGTFPPAPAPAPALDPAPARPMGLLETSRPCLFIAGVRYCQSP